MIGYLAGFADLRRTHTFMNLGAEIDKGTPVFALNPLNLWVRNNNNQYYHRYIYIYMGRFSAALSRNAVETLNREIEGRV